MTGSKDMFMEERERDQREEFETDHPLPIIDPNTIKSSEEIMQVQYGDKPEKINMTSVDLAQVMINAIKEGHVNPLEFAVKKKLITDAFEMASKDPDVKKMGLDELAKYGKEKPVIYGAKISLFTRPKYDYSSDQTWKALKDSIKDVEEKMAKQEERIKVATKNGANLVDEDGTLIAQIVPAPVTESIAVSFSKK